MLGKASEIRTIFIQAAYDSVRVDNHLDTKINAWLEENSNVSVIDIKFTSNSEYEENTGYHNALIIFKD